MKLISAAFIIAISSAQGSEKAQQSPAYLGCDGKFAVLTLNSEQPAHEDVTVDLQNHKVNGLIAAFSDDEINWQSAAGKCSLNRASLHLVCRFEDAKSVEDLYCKKLEKQL